MTQTSLGKGSAESSPAKKLAEIGAPAMREVTVSDNWQNDLKTNRFRNK
jgi:hypothetical protein